MSTVAVVTKKKAAKPGKLSIESSASSRREKPRRASKPSTSRLVLRNSGEPLSQHDLDLLEKLKNAPDRTINFADIPEITVNTFANRSGILSLFKPYKLQLTLRLDADIIAWAKRDGDGYQSRINAALRKVMMDDLKQENSKRR